MSTHKGKFFSGGLLILLVSGIVFAGKPKWLASGYDKKYPAEKYLCGVGVGTTLDEARANARAEISKIFRTRISQSEVNIQQETSAPGKKDTTEFASHTAVRTDQTTSMVLEGLEISNTYFDKKTKTYYARAVLNRQNAKKTVLRQMAEIDDEIARNFSLSQKTSSTLEKIPLLVKVLKLQKQQEELARQRHILDPDYPGDIIKVSDEVAVDELKKKIKFAFGEDTPSEIKSALAEKISAAGFVVTSAGAVSTDEQPIIIIETRIKISSSTRENPQWKFARWEIDQNLLNDGRIISSQHQSGEESQLTEDAASDRAQTKAISLAAELLLKQINENILNVSEE